MGAIPWRDDPVETAKLDQGRADGARVMRKATQFILVAEDADGFVTVSAACDGHFMLAASEAISGEFLSRYLEGGTR